MAEPTFSLARPPGHGLPVRSRRIADSSLLALRGLLVCPDCRGSLIWTTAEALCSCGSRFPIDDGIPVLLPQREWPGVASKRQQADFLDRQADEEFETARPHGAPRLCGWYYGEKLRPAVSAICGELESSVAIAIRGGSVMDAEFLAAAGCAVISLDVSLGASRRTRERAARYGLPILWIVADAESLPLTHRSVDVAYAHDGLHQVERPFAALCRARLVPRHPCQKAVRVSATSAPATPASRQGRHGALLLLTSRPSDTRDEHHP